MHTVLVKYKLPKPVPRAMMLEGFKGVEARFRGIPTLIRKYFCYDEENHTGHSVYLWESEEAAKKVFNDEFVADFQEKFGTTPEFFGVDTLMVVDNENEKTIIP